MIAVVDASSLVELLDGSIAGFDDAELHVPDVADVEVFSVLRRLAASGGMTASDARERLDDFRGMALTRHAAARFLPRMWDLRHDVGADDAAYVALAEALDVALVTSDRRLARTAARYCAVTVPPAGGGGR